MRNGGATVVTPGGQTLVQPDGDLVVNLRREAGPDAWQEHADAVAAWFGGLRRRLARIARQLGVVRAVTFGAAPGAVAVVAPSPGAAVLPTDVVTVLQVATCVVGSLAALGLVPRLAGWLGGAAPAVTAASLGGATALAGGSAVGLVVALAVPLLAGGVLALAGRLLRRRLGRAPREEPDYQAVGGGGATM